MLNPSYCALGGDNCWCFLHNDRSWYRSDGGLRFDGDLCFGFGKIHRTQSCSCAVWILSSRSIPIQSGHQRQRTRPRVCVCVCVRVAQRIPCQDMTKSKSESCHTRHYETNNPLYHGSSLYQIATLQLTTNKTASLTSALSSSHKPVYQVLTF